MLNKLSRIIAPRKKRVGRGFGSGKGGHTTGRGQKGQKSRGKIPVWFEGGQLPLIRRTPFIKGKNRFKSIKEQPIRLTLSKLNSFKAGANVDEKAVTIALKLSEKSVSSRGFKVIATGKLDKALTVNLPVSAGARKAIESAGGQAGSDPS
ncbi:50S ribosomal protein L15 [Candidatus Collierbacteria bacterium]|nr:50S ribosomal protein L15 [Candidatus Collierbacteria bacterium]